MSLDTLRHMRLQRKRPASVKLVTRDCPRNWVWLLDDPAIVWLPQRTDVRAHDLRPLVGLQVTALVDDVQRRVDQVTQAVADVGGVLVGIADDRSAIVTDDHPWANDMAALTDDWREMVAPVLVSDRNFLWRM